MKELLFLAAGMLIATVVVQTKANCKELERELERERGRNQPPRGVLPSPASHHLTHSRSAHAAR